MSNINKKGKKKKTVIIILIIVIVLAIIIGRKIMQASQQAKNLLEQMSPQQVEVTAERGEIKVLVTGSGSVEPADKRVIKSEIDGTVDDVLVSEGQLVEENQLIASLKVDSDDKNDQLKMEDAKLNLEIAKNELNNLYEQQANLKVYASTSGTISDFDLKVGDEVTNNVNKTKILTINNVDTVKAKVYYTKNQFDSINVGDTANLFFPDYLLAQSGKVLSKDSTPVSLGSGAVGYAVEIEIENMGAIEKDINVEVSVVNDNGTFSAPEYGKIVEEEKTVIFADVSGEVEKIHVKNGEYVNEGDLLLELRSNDLVYKIEQQKITVEQKKISLDELQDGDTVYAPVTGTILSVNISEEDVVDRSTTLVTLANLEDMEIVIGVDELDITNVEIGQKVNITCDVFENEQFTGTVSKIAFEGYNSNGVTNYDVTIKVDDRKQLMSGMNVDVEILAAEKSDALLLPIEAVQKIQTKYIVMTKNKDGETTPIPIEIGLANDNYVEVVSGLNEGDTVVYMKEATIDINNMQEFMMPGMGGKRQGGKK